MPCLVYYLLIIYKYFKYCIVLCLEAASNLLLPSTLIFKYSKFQGYAIYCEVTPQVLDQFKQYLQEGKVLYICNTCVERAKPGYRVVDAPYMLKFIMRTQIFEGNSNDTSIPKYVFSLTPIEMLPQYARRTDRFLGNKKNNNLHIYP